MNVRMCVFVTLWKYYLHNFSNFSLSIFCQTHPWIMWPLYVYHAHQISRYLEIGIISSKSVQNYDFLYFEKLLDAWVSNWIINDVKLMWNLGCVMCVEDTWSNGGLYKIIYFCVCMLIVGCSFSIQYTSIC